MNKRVQKALDYTEEMYLGIYKMQGRFRSIDHIKACHQQTLHHLSREEVVSDLGINLQIIVILHDILEDFPDQLHYIINNFGLNITRSILALTQDPQATKEDAWAHSIRQLDKEKWEVKQAKIFDTLDNLRLYNSVDPEEVHSKYIQKAMHYYLPLAKVLNEPEIHNQAKRLINRHIQVLQRGANSYGT